MTAVTLFLFGFALIPAGAALAANHDQQNPQPKPTLAHVSNTFHLVVHAPMQQAGALFGPDGERSWAGQHWNPVFLSPQPGKDIEGAVFTVQHGPHTSVWVNTLFDLTNGKIQYVCFLADTFVFSVDVRLVVKDASTTAVDVTYVQTALDASANETVEAMGRSDRDAGPDWQHSIDAYLKKNQQNSPSGAGHDPQ